MTESLKTIIDSTVGSLLYRLERKRYCLVESIKTSIHKNKVGLHLTVLRHKPGHAFTDDTTRVNMWFINDGAEYKLTYEIYEPCIEFVNSFYLRSIVTDELISWWNSVCCLVDLQARTKKIVDVYKRELIESYMHRINSSLISE